MQLNTDTCEFGPFLCPIPGCSHKAHSGEWREHFIKDHWDTVHHCYDFDGRYNFDGPYDYGVSWPIIFHDEDLEEDRYCSFLGPGKDVFLLVKEAIRNGHALSFYYIDLPDLGPNYFECKLRVQGGPYLSRLLPLELRSYLSRSLQSELRVVSIKEWKRGKVHGSSLLICFCYCRDNDIVAVAEMGVIKIQLLCSSDDKLQLQLQRWTVVYVYN
ncbi:uncharacterized protein LOC144576007 [Carex rostrata]